MKNDTRAQRTPALRALPKSLTFNALHHAVRTVDDYWADQYSAGFARQLQRELELMGYRLVRIKR